ncbi:MAG: S8 family serine peptidase [candidate division Zixibacteria bacterium]|nr:S8 family serine peptidase [candidate division Zixibacteria bacterium]
MRRGFGLYSVLGISLMLVFAWGFHPAAAPDSADLESSQFVRFAAGARHLTAVESDQFFRESATSPYAERGGVIQFDRLPDSLTRVRLAEQGVVLRAYLPDRAYLATIPSTTRMADLSWAGIQWVGALRAEEKLAEVLATGGTPQFSRDSSGASRIKVKLYDHVRPEDAATWLASQYGARIVGQSTLANVVEVALPADNWFDIAHDERVVWLEPYLEPMLLNNSCRAVVGADVAQAAPYSLDGSGVWIGEWDGGWADKGHPDFEKRVTQLGGGAVHWHSTHVAGTVIGTGTQSGGTYKGIAPAANLVSQQWWGGVSDLQSSYQTNITDYHIDISQNSWGTGASPINVGNCNAVLGNYFIECGALDDIVRGDLGKPVSISWSAGNERSQGSSYCGSIGFTYGSLTPYGTAKNLITVGAINSNNSSMTSFSSWGPTDDGRIKPELVAPGCQSDGDYGVTSTWPGGGYNTICGTSMASPVVSGCMALWYQQYRNLHPGQNPLASTVKSVFVETADDLAELGPSYDFGYGRINVVKAIDLLNAGSFLEDQLNDGTAFDWTFNYDGSLPQVSFTLAWDDPGAAENANPTLVNDLDLALISPSGLITLFPWRLDPANPLNPAINAVDHINNLEQVRRTTLPETGLWKVRVTGYGVAMGPQKFSLAYTPGIVLSQVEADYAAQLIAGANQSGIPGHLAFTFQIRNLGRRDDTYDLALTGARGWTISPNPITPTVQGLTAGNFTFDDFVPYGTQPGVVDTIIALMTSNANPAITATDTLSITVSPGFGVVLDARLDTAGVPSRVITKTASLLPGGDHSALRNRRANRPDRDDRGFTDRYNEERPRHDQSSGDRLPAVAGAQDLHQRHPFQQHESIAGLVACAVFTVSPGVRCLLAFRRARRRHEHDRRCGALRCDRRHAACRVRVGRRNAFLAGDHVWWSRRLVRLLHLRQFLLGYPGSRSAVLDLACRSGRDGRFHAAFCLGAGAGQIRTGNHDLFLRSVTRLALRDVPEQLRLAHDHGHVVSVADLWTIPPHLPRESLLAGPNQGSCRQSIHLRRAEYTSPLPQRRLE